MASYIKYRGQGFFVSNMRFDSLVGWVLEVGHANARSETADKEEARRYREKPGGQRADGAAHA